MQNVVRTNPEILVCVSISILWVDVPGIPFDGNKLISLLMPEAVILRICGLLVEAVVILPHWLYGQYRV